MIAISVFFLFLTSLTQADCVCTALSYHCFDGYESTCMVCGSLFSCDSIYIIISDYELIEDCIYSNIKVPYLEMYAESFTLQDNFFKTSGGIHFKRTSYMYWYGFNNFEQINEVTYVDSLSIVHKSALNMNTGYLYFPSPVDFNMDETFTLSGDAIFEFGGNAKGSQFLRFGTTTTTLRDESILNISNAYLWDPVEFRLYNNSKLVSAAVGRDNNNGKFYFYDSSTFILDEGHYGIFMPFTHYFYDNSILQVERDTNSYLKQVYLNDNSLLNISESSFIRFGSFSLSSTSSVEIGEDSVIQTPLSSLNGEITFNNKARLNSKTSTTSLQSYLSLNVIETIIGYPIISLWNENSMLNNINEIIYNGSECIDVYSFASSNDDLKLPSKYYQLANNQLIRYCPYIVDYDVHCYLNTSIWSKNFSDDNNYPIFISPHCMNSHYSNYLCHSIQNTFKVGSDPINITFAEILDTIIIAKPSSNQQIINGYFNTIETTFGLKFIINQNTIKSTLKSEVIEPNTFIEIDTSTTINTSNYEIQLDLTSLTSNSSSIYLLNATIIEIIDDSNVTLDYSTPYIQFINSNNYQIDVDFTQNEIGLYSENGFDINNGNICYFVLFQNNNFTCLKNDKLQKSCNEGYYESNNDTNRSNSVSHKLSQEQKIVEEQPPQQSKPSLSELIAMQKAGTLPKDMQKKEVITPGTDASQGTQQPKPSLSELIAMQKSGTLPKDMQKKEVIVPGTDASQGTQQTKPTLSELIAMQKSGTLPKDMQKKEVITPGTDASQGTQQSKPSLAELIAMQKAGTLPKDPNQQTTTPTQAPATSALQGGPSKPSLAELIKMKKAGALPEELQKKEQIIAPTTQRETFIHRDVTLIEKEVAKYSLSHCSLIKEENLFYSERELGVMQNMFEFFMKRAPGILSTMFSDRDKAEELADAVLSLTYSKRLAMDFVSQMLKEEFARHTDHHSLFRENTSATRVAKSFLAKLGRKYLLDIYKPFVLDVINSGQSFEVDDHRETDPEQLEKNKEALISACKRLFDSVINSFDLLPPGVKLLARVFSEYASQYFGELSDEARNSLTGSFIMLRYVNPAIFSPEKYGIVDDPKTISMMGRRNLILVSKVLQNVSNGVKFIPEKEPFYDTIKCFAKNFPFVLVVEDTAITDIKPIALLHKELCTRADEIIGTSPDNISEEFSKYMVSLGHEAVYLSSFTFTHKGSKVDAILLVTLHHIVINKMGMTFTLVDGTEIEGETVHPDQIISAMIRAYKPCYPEGNYSFEIEVAVHRKAQFSNVFSFQTFDSCGGFSGIYQAYCAFFKTPVNESVMAFIENTNPDSKGATEVISNLFNTTDPHNRHDYLSSNEFKPIIHTLKENKYFTKLVIESTPLTPCITALKELLENNNTLTSISLIDVQLHKEWPELLKSYCDNNKTHLLKELNIAGNTVSAEGMNLIAKIIIEYGLEKINLSGCLVNEKTLTSFFEPFEKELANGKQFALKSINLNEAKISSNTATFLQNGFSKVFPNIEELYLQNVVPPKGYSIISILSGLTNLVVVDLSGFKLPKKCDCEFATLLPTLTKLKQLHLSDSSFPSNVLKDILLGIKSTNVLLDLSKASLDAESVDVLAESLSSLKTISSLDVSQTQIKNTGIAKLLDALVDNTSVECLNISKTITVDERELLVTSLTKYVRKSTSLKSLIMVGGNKPEQQLSLNMIPVLNALVKNDYIESLDIQSQAMGNKGAFALANLLKITKTLQSLKWDENGTGMNGIRAVVDSLRVNTTIKEVQLPILDCRSLQTQGKFGNGKLIGELVKAVKKNQ
ncbi:Ras-GAP domain-containing protein [Entamoeba marina]